jgi:RNA polymerase sigma factor (sigma-70 family)
MRDASNPILRRTVSDAEAREAFGELVRRYQGAATAYAYALLRNYSGAEDAAQAAFLSAWLHRHELRDPQAFGGWLRTIVRTECSRITRRASVTTVPIDIAFTGRAEPSTDDGPDRERRQLLLTAINALPDSDRSLIALRYMSDFSYDDICAFLELPLSTVKKRLHDARKRLRQGLLASTGEARTRLLLRRPREGRDPRLQEQIMQLTEFLDSVASGDVPAVAAALDAHPEWLDATDQNLRTWRAGWNALALAAVSGQAEAVQLLLARGAHAAPITGGVSLIAIAAVEGRGNVVDVLVHAGVPIDLFAAAAIGDVQRVTALLRGNPAVVHEAAYDGKTALHFCRSTEVAEALLTAGAPIDAVDDHGQTPLQWISNTGRYKAVCRYLIAHGAGANPTDIFWACSYGDVPAVLRFLEIDGSLVNARRPAGAGIHASWTGRTPLHEAAMRGETAVGRLLIHRGAEVNAVVGDNVTPLHLAAVGGHRETVELLVAASADPNARDTSYGATPGEWARFWGHQDLAGYLTSLQA